jgi:adenylyl cyclase-associated protein
VLLRGCVDGCKKTAVVLDDLVSSLEVVNSESIQAQTMGAVPTISIDKTDGCMIYLSKASLSAQIVTAKSSAMNILVPDDKGEYVCDVLC